MDPSAPSFIAQIGFSAATVLVLAVLGLLLSSYVKIVTVLSIIRIGLGAYSLPTAFVTGGLALALSLLVMFPTLRDSARAMDKSLQGKGAHATDEERALALESGMTVWKGFLLRNAHASEKQRFSHLAAKMESPPAGGNVASGTGNVETEAPAVREDEWRVVVPAFFVSELKEAFSTGLTLFLPFLVIDLLVANVLVALGLVRIDPCFVSLPFKLLLFVMLDGWSLITGNLVATYAG